MSSGSGTVRFIRVTLVTVATALVLGCGCAHEPVPASDPSALSILRPESPVVVSDANLGSDEWIESFQQAYLQSWRPPYSYVLGKTGGTCVVEAVINKSGHVSRPMVREAECHSDLQQASVTALKNLSGDIPLPENYSGDSVTVVIYLEFPSSEEWGMY